MKRGEITAFLSLVFVLLVSFIAAMLESASIQMMKNQKRLDADRAIFSMFGEYQTCLLEDYEVLAIDGSYGTGDFKEENLTERMHYYGTLGMEHEIEGIQFLTDGNGSAFREQLLVFMEHTYGISIVRNLTGLSGVWEEQELQGQEAAEQDNGINRELEETLAASESSLPAEDNPLIQTKALKESNILNLVLPKEYPLSEKTVDLAVMPSGRSLRRGRGSFYVRQGMNGVEERLLLHEYYLTRFGNALDRLEDEKSLFYEIEYLLGGQASDVENLESVLKKLLLIRFGGNWLYLQSDTGKQAEAEGIALTLSTIATLPAAAGIVKQALLAAWAYGESIVDLRALMSGKRTALVKSSATWQLSLSDLLTLGTTGDANTGMDVEGGFSYQDYLRVLLFLKAEDEITVRALDRVEQNIRAKEGCERFSVDDCVTKLKVQNRAEIHSRLSYQFPVYFGYEQE